MQSLPTEPLGAHNGGAALHEFATRLFPITRSITGDGVRQTLRKISEEIPLEINEVPTGTPVLDWEVPDEWNIRDARIEALDGRTLVEFKNSNLHVVSYSTSVDRIVTWDELAKHVHTLPDEPALIPYRTGYYAKDWGFCLAHSTWETMTDARYRVFIDSTLAPGSLTYGEMIVRGEQPDEFLISVHCCHPSLANDNLSGIVIATKLAKFVMQTRRRLTYRFLFLPATIGSLTWLARNDGEVGRVKYGLVLTCLGDPGKFHYKQSRIGRASIDRVVAHVMRTRDYAHSILPFSPYGYDERQYCSPGYNLPVGCFMRSPNGTYPEYHTSADNLDFIQPDALEGSLVACREIIELADANRVLNRVDGRGEPQLGRRGLYRAISGQAAAGGATQLALLWVLNLADGQRSLVDMAERANMPFWELKAAADLALDAGLVREVPEGANATQKPARRDGTGTGVA